MVQSALRELKEKKGSSRSAILKYISSHYNVDQNATKGEFSHLDLILLPISI